MGKGREGWRLQWVSYLPVRRKWANELLAESDGFAYPDMDAERVGWVWRDKGIGTKTGSST